MNLLTSILNWLAGNGAYMKLTHCMGHDTPWIAATVALDLANALGYALIAIHWWRNARHLPKVPAKDALGNIRNIFVFCGICGYLFIPIKMFWPAWRLYDLFMAALVFYTWRYALASRDLKVVYSALGKTTALQEQLEHSLEESRGKARFLNALSHDLRTPLNGLMLQTNLAELSLQDPQSLRGVMKEMRDQVTAAASLLDSLLEFARIDWSESNNKMTRFPLREVIEQVMAASKPLADQKNLALGTRCGPDLEIFTDRVKLERILANLVSNAIKFTEHGSVRVEVDPWRKGTEIHVIDTGIGIDPRHQSRLFEDFYQVSNHERNRTKGFGLGLSISRRLARQLGGDLVVDSALERGSRFSVFIPSDQPADPTIQSAARLVAVPA